MSFMDRFKKAARQAVEKVAGAAEQGLDYAAKHGPGFIGEGAAEFVAERDYQRARELAGDELLPSIAKQIIDLLLPHWETDSRFAILINQLLGESYELVGDLEDAREHYQRALLLLRDPAQRTSAGPAMVEATGKVVEDVEAEVLTELARLLVAAGAYDKAIRYTMQALDLAPTRPGAYRSQGIAFLKKGLPEDDVLELWMRCVMQTDQREQVLSWIREFLPERYEEFERLIG